jgi:hypothetical protein
MSFDNGKNLEQWRALWAACAVFSDAHPAIYRTLIDRNLLEKRLRARQWLRGKMSRAQAAADERWYLRRRAHVHS